MEQIWDTLVPQHDSLAPRDDANTWLWLPELDKAYAAAGRANYAHPLRYGLCKRRSAFIYWLMRTRPNLGRPRRGEATRRFHAGSASPATRLLCGSRTGDRDRR